MTQVRVRQAQMQQIAAEVQGKTKMSEMEYKYFIYQQGLIFINHIVPPKMRPTIERSAIYWKWWRNEYYLFEKDLLTDLVLFESEYPDSASPFDVEYYKSEMQYAVYDDAVSVSFKQLLKTVKSW